MRPPTPPPPVPIRPSIQIARGTFHPPPAVEKPRTRDPKLAPHITHPITSKSASSILLRFLSSPAPFQNIGELKHSKITFLMI